jgi:hypothetical protein
LATCARRGVHVRGAFLGCAAMDLKKVFDQTVREL